MICPLCGSRKARRACPALGHGICPVCCGTKRLTEIRCPASCAYLTSAREHPAAARVRQRQGDIQRLVRFMRDFNDGQSRLFLLTASVLRQYQPEAFQPLIDEDVKEAAASLAATFETASRGVIYEHRAGSRPAERLATQLKQVYEEAGRRQGSTFEREAAVVLRRLAEGVDEVREADGQADRAFLDFLIRVIGRDETADEPQSTPPPEAPRLIVP